MHGIVVMNDLSLMNGLCKLLEWTSGSDSFNLDDGDHLLSLLHDLTSMGAVMRTIMSAVLIDEKLYGDQFPKVTGKLLKHSLKFKYSIKYKHRLSGD